MSADISPELKKLIDVGQRMKKSFRIKSKHIKKALKDLRNPKFTKS